MAEEQPQSIADRIAALKLGQVGRVSGQPPPSYEQATTDAPSRGRRPPPPPPPRPTVPARPNAPGRTNSSNVPPTQDYAPVSNGGINNQPEQSEPNGAANGMHDVFRPALPPRTSTQSSQSSQAPALPARRTSESPALPPRRPSEAPSVNGSRRQSEYSLSRRESNESMSSIATGVSAFSNGTSATSQSDRVKAPTYDPSALPALPPKRSKEEKEADYKKYNAGRIPLKSTKSTPNVQQKQVGTTPPPPPRPTVRQNLPSSSSNTIQEEPANVAPAPPPRQREIAPPPPKRSALTMGLNNSTNTTPPVPTTRPGSIPQTNGNGVPPPVPTGSRPDLAALQASKPTASTNNTSAASYSAPADSCLLCRDFSGPDSHAARFPRQSLPSQDIGWLAQQLTAPFPSLTDKARALFTWQHHNIAYDVVAFFGNNLKSSTPQSTIQSGLAVCEGYAGLFAALAMKVGLEAVVVSGASKGYGHSALRPGDPIPPYKSTHAWNAVKIDGGVWKLIDCCWGAGHVQGAGKPYVPKFSPERFTQSNDEFGLDHYPGDASKQLRNDGRIMSYEEFILGNKNGCGADFFSGFVAEEGLAKTTFQPVNGKISLSQLPGPTVRFSFQKICPHYDPVRCGNGPYFLYVLHLEGLDGTQRNHIPFETNGDVWWCDVPARDLGRPGMKAQIYTVTSFDGGEGRGLTIQRYRERKGRCGMGFGGVCKWEVVQ